MIWLVTPRSGVGMHLRATATSWAAPGTNPLICSAPSTHCLLSIVHPLMVCGVRGISLQRSYRRPRQILIKLRYQRDYKREQPVSDAIFTAYKSLYRYDKTALNPRVEFVDDKDPRWRKEKVTFNAGYGNERM